MSRGEDLPTLPHYLGPGLRIVFVGYNPGLDSARLGHYYARPGNAFWRHLNASGLVRRSVGPADDALLMDEAGIGFTDLCPRPSLRASELMPEELLAGARRLHEELLAAQPHVAVLGGRQIFNVFAAVTWGLTGRELRSRTFGPQPERIGARTRLWVVPNSSGLASGLHATRLELLLRLAADLGGGADQNGS